VRGFPGPVGVAGIGGYPTPRMRKPGHPSRLCEDSICGCSSFVGKGRTRATAEAGKP
jgi:hypothetical protein